jgi:hypothetical protein
MARRKTLEQFVAQAKQKYSERFKYDKTVYLNTYTPVKIFCSQHGFFKRKPQIFLAAKNARHCPDCMKNEEKPVKSEKRSFGKMVVNGEVFYSLKVLANKFENVNQTKLGNLLEQGMSAGDAIKLLQSGALDGREKPLTVNGKQYRSRNDVIAKLKIPAMWLFNAISEAHDPSNVTIEQRRIDDLQNNSQECTSIVYLKPLLVEAGIEKLDDCYKVRRIDLPYAIQKHIRNGWPTYVDFLEELFEEEEIEWWRLPRVPEGFWHQKSRRQQYLQWLEKHLNFTQAADWYSITADDFKNNFGGALLIHYDQYQLCREQHPNFEFFTFKFNTCPQGFWLTTEAAIEFINYVRHQENWTNLDDLHHLTNELIKKYGGGSLLNKDAPWGNKIWDLLIHIYPTHNWKFWEFGKTAGGLWSQVERQLQFINHLADKLEIQDAQDWYNVSEKDFQKYGGQTLVHKFGDSPGLVITTLLPELDLNLEKFKFNSKSENRIATFLIEIIPDFVFLRRYKHPKLIFSSGRKMELDFFYAELSLAIEYDGRQHFEPIKQWGGEDAFKEIQRRDEEKNVACKNMGIRLVRVNSQNWNGTKSELKKLIVS